MLQIHILFLIVFFAMYFNCVDNEAGAQGENDNASINSANVGQYTLCACRAKFEDHNVTGSRF